MQVRLSILFIALFSIATQVSAQLIPFVG